MHVSQQMLAPVVRDTSSVFRSLFGPGPRLTAGTPLRMAADGAAAVYRIESGWCARTRLLADGRAQIVDLLLPGDLVGLDALERPAPHDTVEALSDVRLGRCELLNFRAAMAEDGQVAMEVARHLLAKMDEMRGWIAVLGQGDARSRMAHLLMVAAERGGGDGALLLLPMTQQRLGELLGLTSVHVNRTVRSLREAGLAIVTRGRAQITDRAGLERIARGYRGEPALAA